MDIGSNTCSMVLVGREDDQVSYGVLEDYSVVTGLARDRGADGSLDPAAIERTLVALVMFGRRIGLMDVSKVAVAATAAVREAPDRAGFLDAVMQRVGWRTDVLSGEQEAETTFGAARMEFGNEGPLALIDVGGASTEIVVDGDGEPLRTSLRFGAVRCTEGPLGRRNPPNGADLAALERTLRAELSTVDQTTSRVVAVGGTPTTLVAIRDAIEPYDSDRVHGQILSHDELWRLERQLGGLDLPTLESLPGMQSGRAPYIVASTLILRTTLDHLGADHLIASDRGLRYGLLYRDFPGIRIG